MNFGYALVLLILLIVSVGGVALMIRFLIKKAVNHRPSSSKVIDTGRWVMLFAGVACMVGFAVLAVVSGGLLNMPLLIPVLLIGGLVPALISIMFEESSFTPRPRKWGRHLLFFIMGIVVVLVSFPVLFMIGFSMAHSGPR